MRSQYYFMLFNKDSKPALQVKKKNPVRPGWIKATWYAGPRPGPRHQSPSKRNLSECELQFDVKEYDREWQDLYIVALKESFAGQYILIYEYKAGGAEKTDAWVGLDQYRDIEYQVTSEEGTVEWPSKTAVAKSGVFIVTASRYERVYRDPKSKTAFGI